MEEEESRRLRLRTESLRPDAAQYHRHYSDVDSHTRMCDSRPSCVLPCTRIDEGTPNRRGLGEGKSRAEKHGGCTGGIVRRAAQAP